MLIVERDYPKLEIFIAQLKKLKIEKILERYVIERHDYQRLAFQSLNRKKCEIGNIETSYFVSIKFDPPPPPDKDISRTPLSFLKIKENIRDIMLHDLFQYF